MVTTFAAGADAQVPQLPQVPQAQVHASVAVTTPGLCGLGPAVSRLLGCGPVQASGDQSASASTGSPQAPRVPATASSSSQLEAAAPVGTSSTTPLYLPHVVVVHFAGGVSANEQGRLLSRLRATVQERIPQLRTVVLSVASVARAQRTLDASPLVAHATRDEVLHVFGSLPDDAFFSYQWGFREAGFGTIWNRPSASRPVVVAVVDTGVDATQPDLAGVVRPEVDLIPGDTVTGDDNGHGTAVAGVIAALANNGIGGAGVCSACSILPIKVMGSNGNGDLATVAAGIVRAADMGARVIDLSLGGPQGLDALQQAVAYANSKGAVVVAAAGNSGLATPFFPAGYPGVISVAGSTQTDRLYPWSEHGPWITVAAPGCNVTPLLHGGYGQFCGTSSATPLVAGLAGLILAAHPRTTNKRLAAAIEQTAKRAHTGVHFGRISAAAALAAAG
jgi:subtilisin family serine protease